MATSGVMFRGDVESVVPGVRVYTFQGRQVKDGYSRIQDRERMFRSTFHRNFHNRHLLAAIFL